VTFARALSDTFARIRAADAPFFIVARIAGALVATFLFRWLSGGLYGTAEKILLSHETVQPGQ